MASKLEDQVKAAENEWMEGWKSGPKRIRWTAVPLQVGDAAPSFEMLDQTGATVNLGDMWADSPALILFWRHYGCGCGMDRAKRLQAEYDDYLKAGAKVVIVGQGETERAAAYAEKYELPPVPVLSDPEYKVYTAFGLLEGKASQILFDAGDALLCRDFEAGARLAKERREADRPLVDNSWLLPGEFVVDQKGQVVLTYRYNYCEDYPDHRVLVAGIREATGELT